ncbi:SDR family NAD(P)-dependent oxidoreductase [Vibrio hippocampi]|uniref:Oxidoreductase n=1 Tax=Vibrio hippocampi TaxID=654686 RepID=A0ABM8ZI42_9VIBR|nr:SDR family NAD(P)-dependent oxidoreductase [Vibrio hippocampi]CAH0526488.1 putative oxidoreductase [Vibrio hippocampi]
MISHSTVFITGATSGIGKQLAQDYAAQGITVYACGRCLQRLAELEATYPSIIPLSFDVTDIEQVKHAVASMDNVPTLWVINAGDCEYIDDGLIDAQLIRRVIEVNFVGAVNVTEAIQPHLNQDHQVVFVSSIAGELALPRSEAYGASKAALSYFARTLQLDWQKRGISVSCVYPGFVSTPLTDKNDFDMPMIVSSNQASDAIRQGIEQGKAHIYFPKRFTGFLRVMALLPYRWQTALVSKLLNKDN